MASKRARACLVAEQGLVDPFNKHKEKYAKTAEQENFGKLWQLLDIFSFP